jgi:hypothetical protein
VKNEVVFSRLPARGGFVGDLGMRKYQRSDFIILLLAVMLGHMFGYYHGIQIERCAQLEIRR